MFYAAGAASLTWCLLWFLLHVDEPRDHICISQEEVKYIEENRVGRRDASSFKVPIWRFMTSPGVLCVLACSIANDFGLYMLLTEGPKFMKNVLKRDIKTVSARPGSCTKNAFFVIQYNM